MSDNNQTEIKVKGGYLVTEVYNNGDQGENEISVYFRADNGNSVDIAVIKPEMRHGVEAISTYCYEDVDDEDYTSDYSIALSDLERVCEEPEIDM